MSSLNSTIPKVTKSGYELAQKLISIYFPLKKPDLNNNDIPKQNRIIGGTDYEKFEKIAIEVEREDILSKKDILKMANPNDIKIQRQMFEGSSKPKIEACLIFKNEGDFFLKNKQIKNAINSYEKALLQLFYNFNDVEEEEKEEEEEEEIIDLQYLLNKAYSYIKKKINQIPEPFPSTNILYEKNDIYPMISYSITSNNILALQRLRTLSKLENLTLIDPSNCGSSLLTPTPDYPNSIYTITILHPNITKALYKSKNSNYSELIKIEAYLIDPTTKKPILERNLIDKCSSLTIYMNPSDLINYDLYSNYSNCSSNGIDIYNKDDPAFIDPCFICKGFNYDLPIEYNRKNIYAKYDIISINENMNCYFEGMDRSLKKVKFVCSNLNSSNINGVGFKLSEDNDVFKNVKNYSIAFKCVNKVSQIYKNFGFWFYTSLNSILIGLSIYGLLSNNLRIAIENDELNNGNDLSSKIIDNNNEEGNVKRQSNDNNVNSFGDCFRKNFIQLHPITSMFSPSIIRNQLTSIWIFCFSLANIFGFNALYFSEGMFENRIKDSYRDNFFYPMKREFHKIIYSILTTMALNTLIRSIVLVSKNQFDDLNNLIKGENDNEEKTSGCKEFEKKMLLRRIIAFVLMLLIDVSFYYYTIVFCSVYINTKFGWFYSGIWGFIWNYLVFANLYIIAISIVESKGKLLTSYYMKRLFCF